MDARYRKDPFKDYPAKSDRWNTFKTGQHIVPGDPSTKDNLTIDEMIGKKPLSEEKEKKFPYVINPHDPIIWNHMQKLDISTDDDGRPINPRDTALYQYAMIQDYIGKVKGVLAGGELYYIEDEENEANDRIVKRDRIYQAENKVRNLGMEGITNLVLLLNHKYKNFYVDVNNTPKDIILDKVFEVIDKEPEVVMSCFTPSAQEELFVAKLHNFNIIQRKGFSFYDGHEYLGDGLIGAVNYMKRNDDESNARFARWSARLQSIEKGEVFVSPVNKDKELIKAQEDARIEMLKKVDALSAFTESVYKKTRIDHLQKLAEDNNYPQDEWDGIDAVNDMRTYLVKKYRSLNNM